MDCMQCESLPFVSQHAATVYLEMEGRLPAGKRQDAHPLCPDCGVAKLYKLRAPDGVSQLRWARNNKYVKLDDKTYVLQFYHYKAYDPEENRATQSRFSDSGQETTFLQARIMASILDQ